MRTRKTGQAATLVLDIASQGTMGVALGLTFAFLVILTPVPSLRALIAASSDDVLLVFVSTCALMFGVGTALTASCLGSRRIANCIHGHAAGTRPSSTAALTSACKSVTPSEAVLTIRCAIFALVADVRCEPSI